MFQNERLDLAEPLINENKANLLGTVSLASYCENKYCVVRTVVYKRNPGSEDFKPSLLNLSNYLYGDRYSTQKFENINQ